MLDKKHRKERGLKIWRYVDLAKFVACPSELKDPYEGWLPRSHMKALMEINRGVLDQMKSAQDTFLAQHPTRDRAPFDALLQDARRKLDLQKQLREANSNFGVNCWHINEHESESMWQLYTAAGQGIAIETTKARLEAALKGDGINVDQVRYADFDRDEIDKGHRHYGLFLKRKSFAHEQELRATILLPKPGSGTLVPCDLGGLIAKIHIFPKAPSYYADAVRYAAERADPAIKAPVVTSKLLDPSDY